MTLLELTINHQQYTYEKKVFITSQLVILLLALVFQETYRQATLLQVLNQIISLLHWPLPVMRSLGGTVSCNGKNRGVTPYWGIFGGEQLITWMALRRTEIVAQGYPVGKDGDVVGIDTSPLRQAACTPLSEWAAVKTDLSHEKSKWKKWSME